MSQSVDKLLRNLRGNSKAQIALCGIGVALVFLVAALLPLLVQDKAAVEDDVELGMRQRGAVYLRYAAGSSGCSVDTRTGEELMEVDTALAETFLAELKETFVVDREVASVASEGREYLTITAGGDTIHVYHYYLEWTGDWSNWMEAFIDADNGDLYYLYVSSQRRANVDYSGIRMDNVSNAKRLGSLMDFEMVSFTDDGANEATAVYLTERSAAKYTLSCIYHVNNLLDIKFTVTE